MICTLYSLILPTVAQTKSAVPVRGVQIKVPVTPAMAAPVQQVVAIGEAPDSPNHDGCRVDGLGY